MADAPFEGWAILELMGHRSRPGYVREVEMAGGKMIRVDIPIADGHVTEFYGCAAVYSMRPASEEIVRDAVSRPRGGAALMKFQPRVMPQLDAWRYEVGAPIPVWVARRAHKLNDEDTLTITAEGGYLEAAPGSWIALCDGQYFVFTDEDFRIGFVPVPDQPARMA